MTAILFYRHSRFVIICLLTSINILLAQNSGYVTGKVTDAATGEPIPDVIIRLDGSLLKTSSDTLGTFGFEVPAGEHLIEISHMSYQSELKRFQIISGKTIRLNFDLINKPLTGEEISIWASRIDPYRIPASISVLGEDVLRYSTARTLVDNLNNLPGVNVSDMSGSGVRATVSIRGMPKNWFSQYMQVSLNGIPQNTGFNMVNWLSIPDYDIEAIEVVRGPALASYGVNSAFGIINVETRKPDLNDKSGLNCSAGYGSYHENEQRLVFNSNLGKLAFRGGFKRRAGEGWSDNSNFETYNLFSKFRYNFNSRTSALLEFYDAIWDVYWRNGISLDAYRNGIRIPEGTIKEHELNHEPLAIISVNHNLSSNINFTNQSYVRNFDTRWKNLQNRWDTDWQGWIAGNKLKMNLIKNNKNMTAGIDLKFSDSDYIDKHSEEFWDGKKTWNFSVRKIYLSPFIQYTEQMSRNTKFYLGLRYDHVRLESTAKSFSENGSHIISTSDKNYNLLNPKVGFDHLIWGKLRVYSNFSYGFREPYIYWLNYNLKTEKTLSLDAGIDAHVAERIILKILPYYILLEDMLNTVLNDEGQYISSTASAKMNGIEMEIEFTYKKLLLVRTAYTYNHSTYVTYSTDGENDLSGNFLFAQPKNFISTFINISPLPELILNLNLRWVDESYLSDYALGILDGYFLTDLRLDYAPADMNRNRFGFSLIFRNVFDKAYATFGQYFRSNLGLSDFGYFTIGDPRTFIISVNYNYIKH